MKWTKNIFTFLLLASTSIKVSYAADVSMKLFEKACVDVNLETDDNGNSNRDSKIAYSASTGLTACLEIAKGDFKSIVKNGTLTMPDFSWSRAIIKKSCKEQCKTYQAAEKKFDDYQKLTDASNNLRSCVTKHISTAVSCMSLAYLLDANERDWDNENHVASVSKNSNNNNGQIQAQVPNQQNNGQANINSLNGENYGCQSKGIETLDYEACKAFADYAQGLDLAHQAVNVGQNLYYQNKALDNGLEASKNAANDAAAGLKAQKNSFKDQQEYYTQNSAIEASKAAILLAKYNALPDENEIKAKCSGVQRVMTKVIQEASELGKQIEPEQNCRELVTTKPGEYALLMNQNSKDAMKQKLVKLGINAIAEGTKAYMAGKRADQVSDAIAQVDSFQPVTTPGLEEAVETTFCQMNPTAQKCQTAGLGSSFSTIGDNIVDFGNNGTGTVYSGTSDNDPTAGGSNGSTGSGTNSKTGVIGSAITGVNKGSGLETTAAAATIGKGNGPTGGGGGGGGGGLGGGGGGGGAAPAAGQQQGTQSAIASKSSGKYSGGAGVSVLGGLGIKGAKKTADNSNPFGNMFDKKGAGDKVLNFRGPASTNMGGKGDNLFDMISKRYGSVNNDKRLIEYEEVTK